MLGLYKHFIVFKHQPLSTHPPAPSSSPPVSFSAISFSVGMVVFSCNFRVCQENHEFKTNLDALVINSWMAVDTEQWVGHLLSMCETLGSIPTKQTKQPIRNSLLARNLSPFFTLPLLSLHSAPLTLPKQTTNIGGTLPQDQRGRK